MELTEREVTLRILKPADGMKIKNIIIGDIFESVVYLGKGDTPENYEEIPTPEIEESETEEN